MKKRAIVVGMQLSGVAASKLLLDNKYKVTINDLKLKEELDIKSIEKKVTLDLGGKPTSLHYDLMVLSPGIPTDLDFVKEAKGNMEVIGTIELAQRFIKGNYIGITGTNGKTTTTALTYEIFKQAERNAYSVGNIGTPIANVKDTDSDKDLIAELSSFQLETIKDFRVHIAAILNITEDHLNRHYTMENYTDCKCNIYKNQTEDDYLVLNYDNEATRMLKTEHIASHIIYFSKNKLKKGFYVQDHKIYVNLDSQEYIMDVDDIYIKGEHNLENALAAVAIAYLSGISASDIRKAVSEFKGVEHRIEYVRTIDGIVCYNDSKATNPESAIVAIKTMTSPTVLIAGGKDKKNNFDEFINSFDGKIKTLILLGETKEMIKKSAEENNFDNIIIVKNMQEAVEKAFEQAEKGDTILLSPACASLDMYDNYEKRGEDFKTWIMKRKEGK